MALTSAALGCVAPSSLAITNSQVSLLHKTMEAVSASSSVFRPRAAIASSSFLGERVACSPAPRRAVNCSGLVVRALNVRASGRIIFTPFGPQFTPYFGRHSIARRECTPYSGGGSNARGGWEKRSRFQEERIRAQREVMMRLLKIFAGQVQINTQNRDKALLRELEQRLKARAGRPDGATEQSDIDELMKNLEERLRPEKQSDNNEATESEETRRDCAQPEYSTIYDYLNAWLNKWDQGMKEERERLQKQWDEANTTQQPERSSEPDVRTEESSSTFKEREDQVYTPEELHKSEENEKRELLEEEEQKKAVAEQTEKIEDLSSTLKEHQDQVYTPEELQKAEEEEKRKLLEEEEQQKAVAELAEKIEESSWTLKERQVQVYTPEELQNAKDPAEGKLLEGEKTATAEKQENTEESLSTVKEERGDQVYTPEELQKAEEEEKRKLLEEREQKKGTSAEQAESEKVENTPNSKHNPSDVTVVHLMNETNGAELYLVGVVHVSQESANEVRDVIRKVQPNYVMVELDRKRYNSLVRRQSGRYDPLNAFVQRIVKTLANDNIGIVGKVMDLLFSGFYQLLALRGLLPGQELQVAIEEGKKVGAKIVLGDQDDDITIRRFGEQMSMADLLLFLLQPMPSDIKQEMSDASFRGNPADMFEMFNLHLRDRKLSRRLSEEMASRAPAFYRILVSERNEVMTKGLRNLSGKVVAVVGLGHLDGIEQLWREANEKYLNETE